MNRITLLVLAVFALGASEARAERMVTVLGLGNKSCGSWTAARRANDVTADIFQGWIAGFLTGSNSIAASAGGIDILSEASQRDAQGLWAWIDNYCQAHPLNSVATAADALGGELIRRLSGAAH